MIQGAKIVIFMVVGPCLFICISIQYKNKLEHPNKFVNIYIYSQKMDISNASFKTSRISKSQIIQ